MTKLGPKPTQHQMELLKKLSGEGVEIHWMSGHATTDSATLVFPTPQGERGIKREVFRIDLLRKFVSWGWLEAFGDKAWAWRNNEYRITDKGRKVVELEVVRK